MEHPKASLGTSQNRLPKNRMLLQNRVPRRETQAKLTSLSHSLETIPEILRSWRPLSIPVLSDRLSLVYRLFVNLISAFRWYILYSGSMLCDCVRQSMLVWSYRKARKFLDTSTAKYTGENTSVDRQSENRTVTYSPVQYMYTAVALL